MNHDVKIIQETANYLDASSDGLIKEGVCFVILNTLYRYMPHKCTDCKRVITTSSESKETKCEGCGTIVCGECNVGKHSICSPCVKILKDRLCIPESFYKKNFLKNQKKELEPVPENSVNDLLNETDTE